MVCLSCKKEFTPGKYNPGQKYCDLGCRAAARRQYKRGYDRQWRIQNPQYMSDYGKTYRQL